MLNTYQSTVRNIHAIFQPLLPEKAHGYCVKAFFILPQATKPGLKSIGSADLPSTAPLLRLALRGFGQKMFERSEFLLPAAKSSAKAGTRRAL
jgi:hypothetical protein